MPGSGGCSTWLLQYFHSDNYVGAGMNGFVLVASVCLCHHDYGSVLRMYFGYTGPIGVDEGFDSCSLTVEIGH